VLVCGYSSFVGLIKMQKMTVGLLHSAITVFAPGHKLGEIIFFSEKNSDTFFKINSLD
jgi:hypothetical protein